MSHTPAPWVAEVDDYYEKLTGWINNAEGDQVVEYAGCGTHFAEWSNPADLTLAIAAPDLLAALKRITTAFHHKTMSDFEDEAIEQAQAAIARAEK